MIKDTQVAAFGLSNGIYLEAYPRCFFGHEHPPEGRLGSLVGDHGFVQGQVACHVVIFAGRCSSRCPTAAEDGRQDASGCACRSGPSLCLSSVSSCQDFAQGLGPATPQSALHNISATWFGR